MNKNDDSTKGIAAILTSLLLFCTLGITVAMLIAILGSALFLFEVLPIDYITHISVFAVFVGSLIASLLSCNKLKKPLLTSIASSVLFLLVLYVAGALLYGRLNPEAPFFGIVASAVAAALLGAVLSASRRHQKKPKTRH